MGACDSLCDGGEGRIGFAVEPIAVIDYLDLIGPAIPITDEMGAGRNGPCGRGGAWCAIRHGGQSAPGCGRMPAIGPALAFVRKNTAQKSTRERVWGSSPEGLLPDPPQAREVQTVQNGVPASCAFYLFIRQPMGRKSALRREIPWILRGFQGRLSC